MDRIPLCVPFERKDEARRAGAKWDPKQRVWTCQPAQLSSDLYAQLRSFVPRMYRLDLEPPYIRPWMVPQTSWGKNLRAVLLKKEWDVVRRHAYASAGNRCRVCGGRGPKWPVEADEAWEYDDATLTQTLKGVIALCPPCHRVRHWGKTMIDGNEEEAFEWVMRINRWNRSEAEAAAAFAFEQWQQRSKHPWRVDYSWVTRVHGFQPDEEGLRRAEAANEELVSMAAARTELSNITGDVPLASDQPDPPEPVAAQTPELVPVLQRQPGKIIGFLKSLFRS